MMMKKFFRRLAILSGLLGIVLIAVGSFVRNRARAVPVWYRHVVLDEATRHIAANNMNQKLLATYGAANDAMAAATRAKFSVPADQSRDLPPTAITLDLSEPEINSFFTDWDLHVHWRERISKYIQDPVVILDDNELILAGTVTDWNMVASLHFEPRLDNGKLELGLKRAMVGTLDLPKSVVQSYISRVESAIDEKLSASRDRAEISPKGWANSDAVAVAMGELLEHTLHDQPAEPVLMLHELDKHGPDARSLPVQITGLHISNKQLVLDLRTMTPDEREALEQHLQGKDANAGVALAK